MFTDSVRLVDGAGLCSGRVEGVLFGEGKHPFGTKEFQCKGTENHLLDCSSSDREEQNCPRGKAVGLACQYVKLVDGSSRCAGTVMLYDKKWRTIEGRGWSMREIAVVCRQLDCGSAVAVTNRKLEMTTSGDAVRIACSGSEPGLKECAVEETHRSTSSAGVMCSDSPSLHCKCTLSPSRPQQDER
ncbi:hypothetical protein MHYP_G00251040 [Metynnis hypsauchen]